MANAGTSTIRVTAEHVRYWLRQFRNDEEVECALRMIRAIKVIGRSDIHNALKGLIGSNPELKGAYLSSAASPRDSGGITSYYAGDLTRSFDVQPVTLSDALVRVDERPIIFVEDFIASGGQLCSTLLTWFNKENDPRVLDEYHGDPLSRNAQEAMKRRRLVFLFAAGRQDGRNALETVGKELGLKLGVHIAVPEDHLPAAFSGNAVSYPTQEAAARFRQRCAEIGKQLLETSPNGPRNKATIPERILGYGNRAFLVAFPYNVPTQTLTLIWSAGKVDGNVWMPLLPRRKK